MAADFAGDHVAHDDALGVAVDQHEIEHLRAGKHLDRAGGDLGAERGVGAEQQLLPGLAAGVESAATPGRRRRNGWPAGRRTRGRMARPGPRTGR